MERQVDEFGARAFKLYNVRYDYGQHFPWRMDDPKIAFPIFEKAQELGVNLIGFAYGELGIGEDVRMAAASCEAAEIPFAVNNFSPGAKVSQQDKSVAQHVMADLPYKVNLFCITAYDTVRVFLERGSHVFENHYNIGYWPWELPR